MAKKKNIQKPLPEETSGEMMLEEATDDFMILEESSSTDVILEENTNSNVMLEDTSTGTLLEESSKIKETSSEKTAAPQKQTKSKHKKPATKPTRSSPNSRSTSTENRTATTTTHKQETRSNIKSKDDDNNLSSGNGCVAFLTGIVSAVYLSFVFFSAMGGWGILLALVIGAFVSCGAALLLLKHRRPWTKILCWSSFVIIWGGFLAIIIVNDNITIGSISISFFIALSAVGLLGFIFDGKEIVQ